MKESSNKMKVNKVMRKINDSSASDAADPCSGLDHVGRRDAGEGQIWDGCAFAGQLAC